MRLRAAIAFSDRDDGGGGEGHACEDGEDGEELLPTQSGSGGGKGSETSEELVDVE